MKKITVNLLESVNGIKFGADRSEVRELMGTDFVEYKKSKYSKNTTDDFGGIHVFYDSNNKAGAFEIYNDYEVEIDNKVVFPDNISELLDMLSDVERDGDYYTSIGSSVGITMNGKKAESVLFGVKDYYNL